MNGRLCVLLLLLAGCSAPDETNEPSIDTLAVPAGPDAAGPRISGGAGRPIILSWMEPDETGTTLWHSTFRDGGWAPPQAVVSGKNLFVNWADMPSVTALGDDHRVAHWLEMAGTLTYSYHVVMSQSFDGSRSWSEPVKPHTDNTPTEHGFVSVYPHDGNVAAIWLDGRKTGSEHGSNPKFSGMTLRSAVIDAGNNLREEQEIDGLICDCCQTDVALTAGGRSPSTAIARSKRSATFMLQGMSTAAGNPVPRSTTTTGRSPAARSTGPRSRHAEPRSRRPGSRLRARSLPCASGSRRTAR